MYKYIVIEGIHGSGKSTVAKKLNEALQARGINSEYLHMPDENDDLGKVIRKTLADKDLYKHREVIGLLYAAFSNIFHIKTKNDDKIYVLERDSVTTGLIFQKDIPRETRLQIYRFGIENLREKGMVFYVTIDKNIALERLTARNQNLAKEGTVWKDKANDQFVRQEFDRLSNLYETEMIPQLNKMGLKNNIVDNNSTIQNTINEILQYLGIN